MRISAAIRLEYMRSLFAQPVSTLDILPPGQTAAIITLTASTLQTGISEKLSALLQAISTVVSAFVISMCYSWSLTLITSSGLVLIIGTYMITTPPLVKRLNEVQHADIQASTTANEVFSSVRMVAACGAEDKMARRYAKWVAESRRRGLKMSPIIAIQQAPSEIHDSNYFGLGLKQMLTRFPSQFNLPCIGKSQSWSLRIGDPHRSFFLPKTLSL